MPDARTGQRTAHSWQQLQPARITFSFTGRMCMRVHGFRNGAEAMCACRLCAGAACMRLLAGMDTASCMCLSGEGTDGLQKLDVVHWGYRYGLGGLQRM